MKEGDVLLAPLPQSDGRLKMRPVILLRMLPPFDDCLVCGVSSQLRQAVAGFDEIIEDDDEDFARCGLKCSSLLRLGFLAVLPQSAFAGRIGSINPERHRRLLTRLSEYLRPTEKNL